MNKRLIHVIGTARLSPVRAGTGSAHRGVVLQTDRGDELILVRIDGNPFNDATTRSLAGHRVDVSGYEVNGVLRFVEAKLLD